MPELIPVEHDPFSAVQGVPVEGDPFAPPSSSPLGVAKDVGISLPVGVAKGAIGLAGLPGDAGKAMGQLSDYLLGKAGVSPAPKLAGAAPTAGDITKGVESVVGELPKPQTIPGEYAQTVGEFAPSALVGSAGILRRLLLQAGLPAVGSETAGQLTKGTPYEPWARLITAMGLAAAPGLIPKRSAIDPERLAARKVMEQYDIPVTAAQATGSRALRYAESELGQAPLSGQATPRLYEKQAEKFTQAIMKEAGRPAERATVPNVAKGFDSIGNEFEDFARKNIGRGDSQFVNDILSDYRDYAAKVSKPNQVPLVSNYITEISNALSKYGNTLPGSVYNSLRSRIGKDSRNVSQNEARRALNDITESLDGLMMRSSNPTDIAQIQKARRDYKNMLVVERAVESAPAEKRGLGLISPVALERAAKGIYGRRSFSTGKTPYTELARAGETLMQPMPESGTSMRLMLHGIPAAFVAGATGNPLGLAASAVPGLAGRALMSQAVQKALIKRATRPLPAPSTSLPGLLLGSQQFKLSNE